MYGIYAISFIMMIFMLSFSQAEKTNDELDQKAVVVARQMIIWHKTAINYCNTNTCNSTGQINSRNIRSELPTAGQNATAFTNGLFTSHFDAPSRTLITVYSPVQGGYSEIRGQLASQLVHQTGGPRTGGAYNYADQQISKGIPNGQSISVPRRIGRLTLDDGDPILGVTLN